MKSLLLGDLHLSATPPSPYRTETYTQDILDKLQASITIANSHNVDCVIQLGDFWHIKNPTRTPHWLMSAVLDILSLADSPIFIVTGNHDISHSLSSLDRQPLGVILRAPNVYHLEGRPTNFEFDIIGIPYLDNPDDWNKYFDGANIGPETLICLHASIFPEAELPPFEAISAEYLASVVPAKYFAYGHIHNIPKKGAYYKAGDAIFCNRGALSRGSLHSENLTRIPGVTLFDSSNPEEPFVSIDLPHKQAEEVFLLTEHELKAGKTERVQEFLESLEEVNTSWITKSGIQEQVFKELGVSSHSLVDRIFDNVD